MQFRNPGSELYVPDGTSADDAIRRTTHLAIAAHQDDLEVLAYHGIAACFQRDTCWFGGVVVTDGAGSPRAGLYASFTDDEMRQVRVKEQRKAAYVGEYGFQAMLGYPSAAVKDPRNQGPTDEILALLERTRPECLYTHNLADKHDTHVAVGLRVLEACRRLPASARPGRLLGCEVWRDLDWLVDRDKVLLDLGSRENLQSVLVGIFDSQISGGKRYDLATMGRRRANATFFDPHAVDSRQLVTLAMDLTPLVQDPDRDIGAFVRSHIEAFATEVEARLLRLQGE